jgi:hypothetical protein
MADSICHIDQLPIAADQPRALTSTLSIFALEAISSSSFFCSGSLSTVL